MQKYSRRSASIFPDLKLFLQMDSLDRCSLKHLQNSFCTPLRMSDSGSGFFQDMNYLQSSELTDFRVMDCILNRHADSQFLLCTTDSIPLHSKYLQLLLLFTCFLKYVNLNEN